MCRMNPLSTRAWVTAALVVAIFLVGVGVALRPSSSSMLDKISTSTDCVELVHTYADAYRDHRYRLAGLAKGRMFRLGC